MGWRSALVALVGAATLVGGACVPPTTVTPTQPTMPTPPASPPSSPSPAASPVPSINPAAQPVVEVAIRDAATRLGISPAQVSVRRVEAQEWRDSSLGCPQPGQLYTQVITPGYLVVLAAGGRELEYHTDARQRAVLCQER